MNQKEQKNQRKKWRKYQKQHREKKDSLKVSSEVSGNLNLQKTVRVKTTRKTRSINKKKIENLLQENDKLVKKNRSTHRSSEMYHRRYERLKTQKLSSEKKQFSPKVQAFETIAKKVLMKWNVNWSFPILCNNKLEKTAFSQPQVKRRRF